MVGDLRQESCTERPLLVKFTLVKNCRILPIWARLIDVAHAISLEITCNYLLLTAPQRQMLNNVKHIFIYTDTLQVTSNPHNIQAIQSLPNFHARRRADSQEVSPVALRVHNSAEVPLPRERRGCRWREKRRRLRTRGRSPRHSRVARPLRGEKRKAGEGATDVGSLADQTCSYKG